MQKMKCKGHRLGPIVTRIKGTAVVMVAVEIFPVDEEGEVTHHVMVGFKLILTQIEERSENGIWNIYQSKGDNSINSMTKDKEVVCYFLKSMLLTACSTVNGKRVVVMRDTGCTGCVIWSSLVSTDQLLGKASDVTLM